jgi:GNAT superfamily N-acetyltransferase
MGKLESQTVMQVEILEADLGLPEDQRAIVALTSAYALDPMGNGGPLSEDVLQRLIPGLRSLPTARVFLARGDGSPIGIATCFLGFSTFAGRPLLNIHDLAVLPEYRGLGVGQRLLEAVEEHARRWGCCKVTLEVLERNERAKRIYESVGFGPGSADHSSSGYWFLTKWL